MTFLIKKIFNMFFFAWEIEKLLLQITKSKKSASVQE